MESDSYDEVVIRQRIESAFAGELPDEVAADIAFHMTDWVDDLKLLADKYARIGAFDRGEIRRFVIQFLAHVPNHLNAAKKLSGVGPTEDVFEAGIFNDET